MRLDFSGGLVTGVDDLERQLRDAVKSTFEARAAAYDEEVCLDYLLMIVLKLTSCVRAVLHTSLLPRHPPTVFRYSPLFKLHKHLWGTQTRESEAFGRVYRFSITQFTSHVVYGINGNWDGILALKSPLGRTRCCEP